MDLALQSAFLAEASALLILMAGQVLLYRSFRERYLKPWITGWAAYCLSKLFVEFSITHKPESLWLSLSILAFVLAVGLLTTGMLSYVFRKDLLLPVWGAVCIAAALGLIRRLWFPDSMSLMLLFAIAWRVPVAISSFQLARFALGRRNFGQWILAAMLLSLHLDRPDQLHSAVALHIFMDLLMGVSIMMIVLDDSRIQVERLDALNAIAHELAESTEMPAMAGIVLGQLLRTLPPKATWFRLLEDDKLVLKAHLHLSESYAEASRELDLGVLPRDGHLWEGEVQVVNVAEMRFQAHREAARREGLHHMVLVPVMGKSARVGLITLGMGSFRLYTRNEKNFLKAAANQLGLAAENRGLVQQLVRSRNEWASTFNSIADPVLVHDTDYRIVRINRALLDRLNRSRSEVMQETCEAVLPGARERWRGCPYCRQTEGSASETDLCFGGHSVVSTSHYTGEESGAGTVHIVKDITATRAAEERYKILFDHMQEGVFVSTPDGDISDCNDALVRMLGYSSKEEILELDAAQALYADGEDRKKFLEQMARNGFVRNFEYVLRCKDGSLINVIESSIAIRDTAGNIERYQGVLLDVTEMKRVEEQIRRRNRELFALNNIAVTFNQSFDLSEILDLAMRQLVELFSTDTSAVYLFDPESGSMKKKSSFGHRSAWVLESDTFQLPAEFIQSVQARHAELVTHKDLGRLPEIMQRFARVEGLQAFLWTILWSKDRILGLVGTSSHSAREFSKSDESVMVAVARQLAITIEKIQLYEETRRAYEHLRRTQEQLLQSEKMSAVGQLISGVAHELNNPLTAILGYAQLLEAENLESRIHDFVLKLHKQAQRTQKIVQNLLSFARQHKPQRIHVDLRSVMEDTIALRDYDLKVNNIVLQREFQANVPSVIADPHQIEQVYLNIINNAADAMLELGQGGLFRIRIYSEDGEVVSEFHDSGPGIADPKRAFDPFYTTKGVGKGTGLGLSICYGIVKEHGGDIQAFNHPSGGAVIQVRLPEAVGEKPITERERIVARRESRLDGRVLLLDDEEAVLEFEREVLTAAGMSVSTCSSGEQAVALLQKERFDAFFLDSKIPGALTSEDVYRWIEEHRPDLVARTVFVMSNVSDPMIKSFVDATHVLCLVKPFEVADLLSMARRVLRRVKAAAAHGN